MIVRTERAESVFVSHHQLMVCDRDFDQGHPDCIAGHLATSRPGITVVWTGVHTGFLNVTVQLATAAPPHPDGWEESTETDLITLTGETMLSGMMGDPPPHFPRTGPTGSGLGPGNR